MVCWAIDPAMRMDPCKYAHNGRHHLFLFCDLRMSVQKRYSFTEFRVQRYMSVTI